VSAQPQSTTVTIAAEALEIGLAVSGLWLAWKCVLSAEARRGRAARLAPWMIQPIDFACFLCFAFVGATLLSSLAGRLLRHTSLGSDGYLVAGGAVMHIGILLGLLGFYQVYRSRPDATGASAAAPGDVKAGVVTFLIAMPIVSMTSVVWEYLIGVLGLPDDKQDLVQVLEDSHSTGLIVLLMAVATLLVPVSEELVFRAGLFRYFRTRVPRWTSILLTSALFGALHMSWATFAPLTVLAIIFCLAYERTGSIRTTIVAHALFNLNTFIFVMAGIGS
jgi:uncharacterized protein